jgi:pimeloyl-ACP methyl ester carboxylesterase
MKPTLRRLTLPDGLRLEIAEQGDPAGTPVVLLHGITDSWRSFETVLPHLPASLRVVSVSQRGHGGSDKPASYRTREFAADAAALIEALDLRGAIVVGHSMGSVNAMRLAIDRRDLVAGVVLAGAFASFGDNEGIVAFVRDAIEPLRDPIGRDFVAEWQQSTLAHPVDPAFFEAIVDETLKVPAFVWRAAFRGLLEDDFTADLPRITAPALLLWGSADAFASESDQQRIGRAVPGARRVTYDDAGHALHWEQPERFAADVAGFARTFGRTAG